MASTSFERASPSPSEPLIPQPAQQLARRIRAVAPSATLAVEAKAKAMQARGVPVISFGAGEPDFPTPLAIVEAAVAACRDRANHRYSPTAGLLELRLAIARKTERDSGYTVDPSQVVVTNGAKQAVAEAFATLLDPGDEVLVPGPYWTTYPEAIGLAGGVSVVIEAKASNGFKVCVDELEACLTSRTKALLICSPANPTGSVYTRDELEAIGTFALEHRLFVVADEIYEHLVYGGATHHSLPVVLPELAGSTVIVNGVSKAYAMTGWRVGWLIGPPEVVGFVTNLQSHVTSNVANVSQRAAIAALTGDQSQVEEMRLIFDSRRKTIHRMLNGLPGVECDLPDGAFYAFASLVGLLGREIRGRRATTSLELADLVLDEAQVAFVPGEAFGAPGYGRFSYALGDDALAEGLERLAALLAP